MQREKGVGGGLLRSNLLASVIEIHALLIGRQ